jgi:ribosomal protein S18 acetylase RimI-like enzyme
VIAWRGAPQRAEEAVVARPSIREETWSLALADDLEDRITAFNRHTTGISDGGGLALTIREAGRVVAGAVGHSWGGTAELKTLWVDEPLRRAGLGRALVERFVAEAEARGCTQLLLATHSFQAPAFYAKLGFRELFRLPGYPRGHAEIWLLRELTPRDRAKPARRPAPRARARRPRPRSRR